MVIAWKKEKSLSCYAVKRVTQSYLLTASSDRDWARRWTKSLDIILRLDNYETGLIEIAWLIRLADYLVLAKTDFDNYI